MSENTIRTVMVSAADRKIIDLWLSRQASPHARDCYRRNAKRLVETLKKVIRRDGQVVAQIPLPDDISANFALGVSRPRTRFWRS